MILTNKRNWSEAWVEADKKFSDDYDRQGWLSCTEIVESIRITLLKLRHWGEITEDISNRVWLIMGSGTHMAMEHGNTSALVEERFLIDISGRQISMKPDRVEYIKGTDPAEYALRDFKTCQCFALTKDKFKWIAQVNTYAHGLRTLGVNVTQAFIEALLKDWKWTEWRKNPQEYPDCAAQAVPIQLWTEAESLEYLERRVREYEAAWNLPDDQLPLCTEDERWATPTTHAVMKPGATRARRVFKTEQEAHGNMFAGEQVVTRPGEDVRCDRNDSFGDPMYCSCRRWCSYYCAKAGTPLAEPDPF